MIRKLTIALLFLLPATAQSQITLDSSDFASAGDTVIYSTASPLTSGIDLTLTGPNQTWNFSQLAPVSQTADTFLDVAALNNLYSLYFMNLPFNPNQANIAVRGSFPTFPGVSITDVYNFYMKNNTGYRQVGIGASLNGVAVPVAYTDKDEVYLFPLNYNNVDTSVSNFGVALTGTGSYYGTQTRLTSVDGWGTITTPYGTFNCLRVVAYLTGHDSVHVDSLNFGMGFDRTPTTEYNWFTNGEDGPVLQIITQDFLGTETITSIKYRDNAIVTALPAELSATEILVYPNPAGNSVTVRSSVPFENDAAISVYDVAGKSVPCPYRIAGNDALLNTETLSNGVYSVVFKSNARIISKQVIIFR